MTHEVRFTLAGRDPLILVPVHVNGRGPYEFILDTGAGHSCVSPELAAALALPPGESKKGHGSGGTLTVSLTKLESLAIGEARVDDVPAAVTDEVHRIGQAIGASVAGVIGHHVLRGFRVTVDYGTYSLRLETAHVTADAREADVTVPLAIPNAARPIQVVQATVDGAGPFPFILDTGASTCVVSQDLARRLELVTQPMSALTGAGGTSTAAAARLRSLALDGAEVSDVPVAVVDFLDRLSGLIGTPLEGIVGYHFLRRFRVTIDYPAGTLRLRRIAGNDDAPGTFDHPFQP